MAMCGRYRTEDMQNESVVSGMNGRNYLSLQKINWFDESINR